MEIVEYRPELGPAFRALNEAWIVRSFTLEPMDRAMLDDPEGAIIAGGGQVLFAIAAGEPVGCGALIAHGPGVFEVAKMAVRDDCKGRGYGRALLAALVERARAAGAGRLLLETNSSLTPALGLYRSFGFRTVAPAQPSPYARADVAMELVL